MLDFSAAFEMVDHIMLIQLLEYCYGVTGKTLPWLKSYFSERSQFVKVDNEFFTGRMLICSVLQGPVLGPSCILCVFPLLRK